MLVLAFFAISLTFLSISSPIMLKLYLEKRKEKVVGAFLMEIPFKSFRFTVKLLSPRFFRRLMKNRNNFIFNDLRIKISFFFLFCC